MQQKNMDQYSQSTQALAVRVRKKIIQKNSVKERIDEITGMR